MLVHKTVIPQKDTINPVKTLTLACYICHRPCQSVAGLRSQLRSHERGTFGGVISNTGAEGDGNHLRRCSNHHVCMYVKRMLRYVRSQVEAEKNASQIVESINVLMAIIWWRQAWNDVCQSTITKCFQKTGLYPRDKPMEDDPFEGEEFANLKTIMDRIYMLNALSRSIFPAMIIPQSAPA